MLHVYGRDLLIYALHVDYRLGSGLDNLPFVGYCMYTACKTCM